MTSSPAVASWIESCSSSRRCPRPRGGRARRQLPGPTEDEFFSKATLRLPGLAFRCRFNSAVVLGPTPPPPPPPQNKPPPPPPPGASFRASDKKALRRGAAGFRLAPPRHVSCNLPRPRAAQVVTEPYLGIARSHGVRVRGKRRHNERSILISFDLAAQAVRAARIARCRSRLAPAARRSRAVGQRLPPRRRPMPRLGDLKREAARVDLEAADGASDISSARDSSICGAIR